MLAPWLRRAAAVTRKRLRRHLRLDVASLTAVEKRDLELAKARRGRVEMPTTVVELPARASLNAQSFVRPRILVLQMAHIGDFILSLRALQKLSEGFPGSQITLVCATWNVDWARQTGFFDRIVAFDFFPRLNADWRGATSDVFARFAALPLGAFDIAVDLRHDADTRPCLYRVDASARAGFEAPLEKGFAPLDLMLPRVELLPRSDGREYSLHAELRLELLAEAVVAAFGERGPHPVTRLAKTAALAAGRPFAILAVGAGDPIRRWPQAQFVELGLRLIGTYNFDIVVVGGAAERDVVAGVVAGLPKERVSGWVDLPLAELTAKVARAALLVGLGSGVAHLAATLCVPTISLLSGVSPLDVWRPIGPRVVNLTGQTSCSPCVLKRIEDCPFGVTCLYSISPERVLAAAAELLRPAPALPFRLQPVRRAQGEPAG